MFAVILSALLLVLQGAAQEIDGKIQVPRLGNSIIYIAAQGA